MTVIYLLLSAVVGALVGYLLARQHALSAHQHEVAQLQEKVSTAEREKAVAQTMLQQHREHEEQLREEQQKQAEENRRLLQAEMKNMAAEVLKSTRDELNTADKQRLESLMNPLKERIEAFTKVVNDQNKDNAAHKTEITSTFENLMKHFSEEQQRSVRELTEQSNRIGNDAANLTRALKGDTKLQGDWGEMILEQTLTDYGLIKDEQFRLQPNYKDKNGNNLRPDAVVHFPNGECVVIDSKVSLTAYAEAMRTDDEEQRNRLLMEHVQSVRRHVDELAAKRYDTCVDGSIGYVLMFIPYESGYAAAIKTDRTVMHYAYKKRIILLSPANLLVALQLTHNMWQNYNVNKNTEEILSQAKGLYDKFALFAESFIETDRYISKAHEAHTEAMNRLRDGKGNILTRITKFTELGVQPNKQLPPALEATGLS